MITPPVGVNPHAGVDRLAVLDRSDAGAVAEMGDDQPARQVTAKLA